MPVVEKTFAIPAADGQLVRGVYRDSGHGPVGAFLHGLLSDAEGTKSMTLWQQAEHANRSWIRFDMRAHGQSDGSFDEFRISRAIEDTSLVLSLFPDRPKVLVGSSMGGWVAAQAALDPTLNIRGLVLIAPAFSFMKTIFHSLAPAEQQQWKETGYKTFESSYPDSDFTLAHDAVVDSLDYDLFSHPVSYNHPVRILHGALDDVVPVNQSVKFQKHVQSQVELEILQQGDHRLTDDVHRITEAVDEIWPE